MSYILGIFFSLDTPARAKANFDSILKSIRGVLNSWKGRGLTLTSKIQILKSIIILKFLSKAATITIPEVQVKQTDKVIYTVVRNYHQNYNLLSMAKPNSAR